MDQHSQDLRQVHFATSCVLILDHEVIIPGQQDHGSTAGAILRVLNPRNLAMHLPMGRGGSHQKRSSSTDTTLDTQDDGSSLAPKLVGRFPSLTRNRPSIQGVATSPTEPLPPRSCLKATDSQSPPIPGSYFSNGGSQPPSPTLTRGRSISSVTSSSNYHVRSHASPPPPPQHPPPHIPTEIIPLRECCEACKTATQEALAAAYRISWSPGAAAKKKRDDAEERGDILAGLKRSGGCEIKWGDSLEGMDEDDGFAKPVVDGDEDDEEEDVPVMTHGKHLLDPLSKLDGTSSFSRNSSTSTINKDWAPEKYYDHGEDEEDLFPLPSPKGSPALGSPASSSVNLPSQRPISPLMPAEDGYRPAHRPNSSLGVPLPTIAGSLPSSPGPGSSRSSVASRSTSAGSQDSHAKRPSPLREQPSTLINRDRLGVASHQQGRPHVSPPPSSSSHTHSITSSGSSGAGRVWTSSFVPPPLPKRTSPLVAAGQGKHKLSSSDNMLITRSIPKERGERAHPPPMPSYSGVQKQMVIVASSKDKPPPQQQQQAPYQPPRKEGSSDKRLPPIPSVSNSLEATPVASRTGTFNAAKVASASSATSSTPRSQSRDPKWEDDLDDALARIPTVTQRSGHREEDDVPGPLTSPYTSPKKSHRSISSTPKVTSSASMNLRPTPTWDHTDEFGSIPKAPPPSGEGGSSRTRSSSFKKLWKNVAGGMGAAAGVRG